MRAEIPVTIEYLQVRAWGEWFNQYFGKKRIANAQMREKNHVINQFCKELGVVIHEISS